MPGYTIIPIDEQTCHHVRKQRTDPIYGYDYDVMASEAGPEGYGPCRRCLKKFIPGERRLLFLHNPFGNELGDFAGPVFIHESECIPFPGGDEMPAELSDIPMFVRSYDKEGHFLEHAQIRYDQLAPAMQSMLENTDAREVHIRNVNARCYIAKAVRR